MQHFFRYLVLCVLRCYSFSEQTIPTGACARECVDIWLESANYRVKSEQHTSASGRVRIQGLSANTCQALKSPLVRIENETYLWHFSPTSWVTQSILCNNHN